MGWVDVFIVDEMGMMCLVSCFVQSVEVMNAFTMCWNHFPTLSQVSIGESNSWMKQ